MLLIVVFASWQGILQATGTVRKYPGPHWIGPRRAGRHWKEAGSWRNWSDADQPRLRSHLSPRRLFNEAEIVL
jgi:hypothetical protein